MMGVGFTLAATLWAIFGVKLMCQDKVKSKKVSHGIRYFYTLAHDKIMPNIKFQFTQFILIQI